jgi:hypothetical protein
VLADLAVTDESQLLVGRQRAVEEEAGGYRAGLPGARFQGAAGIRGIAFQSTLVFAFTERTAYVVSCQYTPPRSAEIQRGCDQIVRTFTAG